MDMSGAVSLVGFVLLLALSLLGLVASIALLAYRPSLTILTPFRSIDVTTLYRLWSYIGMAVGVVPFVILFGHYLHFWWVVPCVTLYQCCALGLLVRSLNLGRGGPGGRPGHGAGVPRKPLVPVVMGSNRLGFPE